MPEYIMYDGIGSKKNGKHTVKEFLKIMNKRYDIYCSNFLPDLEYKPCSQYKELNVKILEYNNKHRKIGFNRSKKAEKKYNNLVKKCQKFKKTFKNCKCNLDEYLEQRVF
jgi:hypothetical protein